MRGWIWILMMAVAACGGGGGDGGTGGGIDPRLTRLDLYEAQKLRVLGDPGAGVMGMATTSELAIPDSGSALFTGSATIRVETDAAPLVLFGDAEVTIGFADGQADGTLDSFFGTNAGGSVVDYNGAITIDGGELTDGVSLDYSGALTGAGENLVFDGTMEGQFLGDPVGALSAADLEADVIVSSTPTDATLVVIAETDGVEAPTTP
ncbi:hypothetical protein SLH49_16430 [Cognatiyoonia sp. IB215446]|uniref:hypothetical protein n=1 Tax=Cognatiyoonia sp. IB215446 TaxID=3097355 RepID=UPI002A13CECC|nr:hypothetical protein [Cognatiyoonia sp. IB215446]MDX8349572.1 hypothetical protein [Cognatiyoonia sp. IB215446]